MGGDMQAQGHAQALVNIFDLGANLQAASDMARFRHSQIQNVLNLEAPLYNLVGAQLTAMGHTVKSVSGADVGGFQSIMFMADPNPPGARASGSVQRLNGFYRAGSDHRKDGQAVGW
jgi:gamma-glutamyltranspeptidase/glutathione hydrolase